MIDGVEFSMMADVGFISFFFAELGRTFDSSSEAKGVTGVLTGSDAEQSWVADVGFISFPFAELGRTFESSSEAEGVM